MCEVLGEAQGKRERMITIGVIGTAGRQIKLTSENWALMLEDFLRFITEPCVLVTGGAAGADALAVAAYEKKPDLIEKVIWHLPGTAKDTKVMYHYWDKFKDIYDLYAVREELLKKGVLEIHKESWKGFKDRNKDVAAQADVLIAYTFNTQNPSVPRDGGTKHTWDEHKRIKPDAKRIHRDISSLGKEGGEKVMISKLERVPKKMASVINEMGKMWFASHEEVMSRAHHNAPRGARIGNNPKINCSNCQWGEHLPNQWESFDRCVHPLLKDRVYRPADSNYDGTDMDERYTHFLPLDEAEENVARFEDACDKAALLYSHRDKLQRDLEEIENVRSELLRPYHDEIFCNRSMFLYGPQKKRDNEGRMIFIWRANPDYCPYHQYNEMCCAGEPDASLLQYHYGPQYPKHGGEKAFHVHPREGVAYLPPEVYWMKDEPVVIYIPVDHVENMSQILKYSKVWDRVKYHLRSLRSQGVRGDIFGLARKRALDSIPKAYADRIRHHSKGKLGTKYAVSALKDAKKSLQEHGIELEAKATADEIFKAYRKMVLDEKRISDGQPYTCPAMRYMPDATTDDTAGAILTGIDATTNRGTKVTPERQKEWKKTYQITIGDHTYPAWMWNVASPMSRMEEMGCVCLERGLTDCPVVADVDIKESYVGTLLDDNALENAIDNKQGELEESCKDFEEGLKVIKFNPPELHETRRKALKGDDKE